MKVTLASILIATAGMATAQDACVHAPLIRQMAQTVIEKRTDLPRLMQARYGDLSAFYAIEYGGADAAEVFDNLRAEGQRPPRLLDDLQWAYVLFQPDGLQMWRVRGEAGVREVPVLQPSTLRALLLADNGMTYFEQLALARADETLAPRFNGMNPFGMHVAIAVSDQPVDVRLAIAQNAEAAGELWMAGAVLADLPDRATFDAFVVRHADAEAFARMEPYSMLRISTLGALTGDAPLMGPDETQKQSDGVQFWTYRAAMAGQPSDFLMIYLNQSGQVMQSLLTANMLVAAVEDGALDPVADPEEAWLAIYRGLLAQSNQDGVQQTLSSFDWPQKSIRSYAGNAMESLDVMVAKDAFGPFVRGETDELPMSANGFAGTQDWTVWSNVAQAVRDDTPDDIAPEQVWIAAELLWEAGAFQKAADLTTERMEIADAIKFLADGMRRLDAICGPKIGVPGGALRYGGMVVFRFD